MNNASETQTIPSSNAVAPATGKRKTAKKTSSTARKVAAKRSARAVSAEILFDQAPNPNVQPQPPYLWIDHPEANARLGGSTYVIRLGVGGAEQVEISVDKGPWRPCRATSGYWWYDWSEISRGKHQLVARMRAPGGVWYKTPPRNCHY